MDIVKNGYIKLPYGFVSDEKNKEKLRFDLPINYKKDVLFRKVPYFAEVNNAAIDDVVSGKRKDALSIQKFLLGKGVLEDAILENLDMIVTDRKFNNAGIRRKLDLKYPSIMKKPTASNFLFRDKKQFDVVNPVIGGLYNQLKVRTADQLNLLKKAPNIKDLKIRNALQRLQKFNLNRGGVNDDDDDDDGDGGGGIPTLPRNRRDEPPLPPPPPPPDDDDDKNDGGNAADSDKKIKKFLLDRGNERIAEGLQQTSDGKVKTGKIAFSKEMTKMFPKIREQELDYGEADVDEFKDEGDLDFLDKTDKYDFPMQEEEFKKDRAEARDETFDMDLDFYAGGDKNSKKLMANAVSYIGQLNKSNQLFLEYLSSNFGAFVLNKNKLKIHLESGQFFHNDVITNESIYDFLLKQQDETKKELQVEVLVGNDFEVYVNELLANVQDNDYDLHTNSTAKFLFYNFNTFRLTKRLNPLTVRHSEVVTNEQAISILQSNNWQYMVEQLLHVANGRVRIDEFDLDDDKEFEKYTIIEKTLDNLQYCKRFYGEVFNDIGYFFQRMIKETPDEFLEPLKADLVNEIFFTGDLKQIESHVDLLKIFNRFYFKTGRFPGNYTDLILVPPGVNPPNVKSFDRISPVELNDKFQNEASYGIAAVHFLAALHIFFSGEKKLSQNVMSELLHNLSYDALNFENTKANIKFDEIIKLNKSLKNLIRDVDRTNIQPVTFQDAVDESQDKVQEMEQEVVNNVLSNKKIDFPNDFKPPMPNSLTQIENDRKKADAIKRKNDESLNQIFEVVTPNEVTKARNDLVKSAIDYGGEIPTQVINNVTSSFKQQQQQQQQQQPNRISRSVQSHVNQSIKQRNQQYFKQRQPAAVNKKPQKSVKQQLKITDIVNRGISRSSSLSSIAPLNEIEMLSRSTSLDSISTMKREYDDQEMISRPPSVSSIRDSIKTNIDLSFKQPVVVKNPIKIATKKKSTIEISKPKPKPNVEIPKSTKPKPKPLPKPEKVKLTPAARVVLEKKIKPLTKIISPPTVSLVSSIENKKKTAAAKADSKTKKQEQLIKWQKDIEMTVPLVKGKRKTPTSDVLKGELKNKKEE